MNNFADDEFTEKDSNPDLDLNTDKGRKDTGSDPEDERPKGFFSKPAIRIPLRVGIGLVILGTALGIYWNLMPPTFKVEQKATTMALTEGHREEGEALPPGYRFVSTLIYLTEDCFLDKPGGLMSNDWNPVSRITDNMRHWEKGFIFQMRVMVQGLRFNLSRIGPQSKDHPQLAKADPLYNFKETSFALPSSERQYRNGVKELRDYLQAMSESQSEAEYFSARQDQLIDFLGRQLPILGGYTAQLQQNIGAPRYDIAVLTSTQGELGEGEERAVVPKTQKPNSFWERDDTFYEVRGGVYVLYHVMLALRKDCEVLINDAKAMGTMNRIINELESANKPMLSPMVLNGTEFGVVQNHSLVLASHLAKAHLAIQELQRQLRGGGTS